jgi:hypothetical protein
MSGVIGGQGFHDVDPLYDAPLAQAFRTGSSNRHAMQASARDSVAQRVDFALLAGRRRNGYAECAAESCLRVCRGTPTRNRLAAPTR